jgi:hypothetical protein
MAVAKRFVRIAFAGVESETGFLVIAISQPRSERGVIATSEIQRSTGKQSHRRDPHIAGHSSPRTSIRGSVCPAPRGTACRLMTGNPAFRAGRPTGEEIALGERPRNDCFELSYCRFRYHKVIAFGNRYKLAKYASNGMSCRRNRILSLKILTGYTACGPSVRPNAAEFNSVEVSFGFATGLRRG